MRRAALGWALLVVAAGATAGCSWTFVEPLASTHRPGDAATCTTDLTWPLVDSAFALTNVGSSVYVATRADAPNKELAVTLGLLDAAVWLSSAVYGYVETSECRAAKAAAADVPFWQQRQPPGGAPPRFP